MFHRALSGDFFVVVFSSEEVWLLRPSHCECCPCHRRLSTGFTPRCLSTNKSRQHSVASARWATGRLRSKRMVKTRSRHWKGEEVLRRLDGSGFSCGVENGSEDLFECTRVDAVQAHLGPPGVQENVTTANEVNLCSEHAAVCRSACVTLGYLALDRLEM